MKKILGLLLMVMLTLGLCSCGNTNSAESSTSTGTTDTTPYTFGDITFEIPTSWGDVVEIDGYENTHYFYPEGQENDVTQSMFMIGIDDGDFSEGLSADAVSAYFDNYNSGLEDSGMEVKDSKIISSFKYPCEYVTSSQAVDNNTYNQKSYIILYNSKFYGIMMSTVEGNKHDYSSDLTNIINSLEYLEDSNDDYDDDYDESTTEEDYDDYDDDYEEATTEAAESSASSEYLSALRQAQSYSESLHMSKQAIYDQLISDYGGQFEEDAAQYAVDHVDADWNANALESAKSYRESMNMSKDAIHDQLTSDYGGKFTEEQADYAIKHLDD